MLRNRIFKHHLSGEVNLSTLKSYYTKTGIDTAFTSYHTTNKSILHLQIIDTYSYANTCVDGLEYLRSSHNNAAWLHVTVSVFTSSARTTQSNPTRVEVEAAPNLEKIADITVASQHISFRKPITHMSDDDPGRVTEAAFQYDMTCP